METIVGTVKSILYESQVNDFKVFGLMRKDRSIIRVTGEFPHIMTRAKIEVHGEFKNHPKYGLAFKSDAHTFDYEKTSTDSICLYIQSIAKWIGPVRSLAIAQTFGENIQEIIEKTPERLMEIEGIGEKIAESIADAWMLNRNLKDIQIFLHELGLGTAKINRIINMFGAGTEQILKDNPWILCRHGFGFTTCDHIASKLEKDMRAPFRFQQFIVYTLDQTMSSGHLFLYPAQLLEAFNKYNSRAQFPFQGGDLTLNDLIPHIKELIRGAYIVNDNNKLYELSSFFYENESARLLSKIIASKSSVNLNPAEASEFIKNYEHQNEITLSEAQADAVTSFFTSKVMIVTGPPGTGKTQTLKAFVQLMRMKGISFELITPTGIAAKKLGNTVGCEAYTIHRRLGYKGNQWDYNNTNKYATDVVVVDECSMVDTEVLYRLVSALYSRTKIVFVGDKDQLPSVGPGSVLKELIASQKIKVVLLDKIFRQNKCSEIILEAKKIRDGDISMDYFRSENTADIWHIQDRDETRIQNTIIKFAQQLKGKAKEKGITFQVITPRNDGPLSVNTLNIALQQALNPPDPDLKEVKIGEYIIRKGDRVIIRKNNYELQVFNGDVGKVVVITPYSLLIDIEDFYDKNRRVEIQLKQAEDMVKLGYVLTVHRCVPYGSIVYTSRGCIPIENLRENDYVLSKSMQYKKVLWSGDVGNKKVLEIITKTGNKIELPSSHIMHIADKDGKRDMPIGEVRKGMFLCAGKKIIDGKKIKICFSNTQYNNKTQINLPKFLNSDMAWMIGALIGNGCYTDKKDGLVDFCCPIDIDLLYIMKNIIESYGVKCLQHNRNKKLYSIYFCSRNLRDWMLSIGMGYVKADSKTIPSIIFEATAECKCAFISGLFDTDGSINKRGLLRYVTVSIKLAEGLQLLLRSIGIISFLSSQYNRRYNVIISGIDTIKFRDIINFRGARKKSILKNYSLSVTEKSNHYEIPFGNIFVKSFKEAFNNNEGNSRGIKGKGLSSKYPTLYRSTSCVSRNTNKFRYSILKKMDEISKKEGFKLPNNIIEEIESNLYYDEIISIKETKKELKMRDLEVEEDHYYFVNGYLGHNCQGMEYSIVILPFIKAHGVMLLQRNLLYTAITRAKKKVVLIGQTSAIEQAIKNDRIQKRNTLLAERINQWMSGTGISMQSMYSRSSGYPNAKLLEQLLLLEGGSN
jgi:exodeoxyribonuclease V alpha subunit